MVHDLQDLIFCDIAVSKDQGIRSGQLVVLVDLLLKLLAQLFLNLFFRGDIVVIGVDPYIASITLNDRHLGFDPNILSVSLLQAVLKLIFLSVFADAALQIFPNKLPIIRMHTGKGTLLIHGPGILMGHIQHFRKAFREIFRLDASVRIMPDHRHAAGKIFHCGLKILLQPLLCPAFLQLLSRIMYIFDARRDPIPVCCLGPCGIGSSVHLANLHILRLCGTAWMQGAKLTRLGFSVQHLIAFSRWAYLLCSAPGFQAVGIQEVIGFRSDHIDVIRRLTGDMLKQLDLRRHPGEQHQEFLFGRPSHQVAPDLAVSLAFQPEMRTEL